MTDKLESVCKRRAIPYAVCMQTKKQRNPATLMLIGGLLLIILGIYIILFVDPESTTRGRLPASVGGPLSIVVGALFSIYGLVLRGRG